MGRSTQWSFVLGAAEPEKYPLGLDRIMRQIWWGRSWSGSVRQRQPRLSAALRRRFLAQLLARPAGTPLLWTVSACRSMCCESIFDRDTRLHEPRADVIIGTRATKERAN